MYRIIDKKKEKTSLFSGIIGGALSLTLSAIAVKIIGLIYKIPISSVLGDVGMGYFNSAYTVFAFFYLLCTAGVPKAVMILLSEARARNNTDEENAICLCAVKTFSVIGIVTSVIFLLFAAPISFLIGNTGAFFTMLAIAPSLFFVSVSGVLRGIHAADSRLGMVAVAQLLEGGCKLVIGLLLAMVGMMLGLALEIVSALSILGVTKKAVKINTNKAHKPKVLIS